MVNQAESPAEAPVPRQALRPAAAPEIVYLDLANAQLRHQRRAKQLLRQPGLSVLHEIHKRIPTANPETISILVTDRRAQIRETTYALRQISSASSAVMARKGGWALYLIATGALLASLLLYQASNTPVGGRADPIDYSWFFGAFVLIGIGIGLYRRDKGQFAVSVALSSVEVDAMISPDREIINRVHYALTRALAEAD